MFVSKVSKHVSIDPANVPFGMCKLGCIDIKLIVKAAKLLNKWWDGQVLITTKIQSKLFLSLRLMPTDFLEIWSDLLERFQSPLRDSQSSTLFRFDLIINV